MAASAGQGIEQGLFFCVPVEVLVDAFLELFFTGLPAEAEAVFLGFFFFGLPAESTVDAGTQ